MSKILRRLLAVALLVTSIGAAAAPLCLPGTLQDYIDLGAGGCEIAAATFAGFYLASGQNFATPIDPSLIQVTPSASPSNPGLLFTLNAAASGSDLLEAFFHFQVGGPGVSLTGARAVLDGASATGNGVALLVEDLCLGGAFLPSEPALCSGSPDALIAFATELDSGTDVSTLFAGVDFIDVFADFSVDGGLGGTAVLGSGLLSFATAAAPAPEPPTLPLTLVAFTIAAVLARGRSYVTR